MKKLIVLFCVFYGFNTIKAQAPYSLPDLPYAYNALEESIDAQTMEIHHKKHHQAYINNLNDALKANPDAAKLTLMELFKQMDKQSPAIRNNAGGHYNHSLFWKILSPTPKSPSDALAKAIQKKFVSMDSLKTLLNKAGASRFGSGWAWLSVDAKGELVVSSTPNQDNPLMNVAEQKGTPILGIDVWEHAYYLKYQNKRGDYMTNIWKIINWEEVSTRYAEAIAAVKPNKYDKWTQLQDFHKVMGQTFHPMEDGNFGPIKKRSSELYTAAQQLAKAPIPAEFNKPGVSKTLEQIVEGSKKVNDLVAKNASYDKIGKALNGLHDTFHKVMELCSGEHH